MSSGETGGGRPRVRRVRGGFLSLLVVLVAFLLLAPVVAGIGKPGLLVSFLFAVVLLVGVHAMSGDRRIAAVAGTLAVVALLLRSVRLLGGDVLWETAGWAVAVLFLAFTAVVVLRRVLAPGEVDTDRIAGAVCVYLLLGLLWSFLYALLETFHPGSFNLPPGRGAEIAFTYFSFSTLTTLGYGDVTPWSAFARTLAWMEAVAGQMFLAVTVATLVGLRIGRRAAGGGDAGREG